ncbi:hypothetical protein LY78DRAFT_726294 [Colletotrichum sublineola]|nr:hypothetical protein LY78DRAFT_726294 [Colletotrichum sublineola]
MDSKNVLNKQIFASAQSPVATSASRPKTPNEDIHLKSVEPVNKHSNTLQDAVGSSEANNNAENDNVADLSYEELESVEHRVFERMHADRKNRMMEIYFSRIGSKIQWGRSREARLLSKHRRLSRDDKRKMD